MRCPSFLVGQQADRGGTNGITNFGQLFGATLRSADTQQTLYLVTVAVLALTYRLARAVTGSRLGRVMVTVRDDETHACFVGYNVAPNASVFAIAAALAGIAGALFVPQAGIISPGEHGCGPVHRDGALGRRRWPGHGGRSGAGALAVSWARSVFSDAYPESWVFLRGALTHRPVITSARPVHARRDCPPRSYAAEIR